MANAPRKKVSESVRYKILRETNFMCIYCGGDANQVDHIIPYSYSQNNDEINLVPACGVCNGLASNKVFDSLAHKMLFVNQRRKSRKLFPIVSGIEIPTEDTHDTFPEQKLFDSIEEIKAYFITLFENYSYNEIALAYGINKGVVWKIIKSDYEPKKNEIRRNIGLHHLIAKPRKREIRKPIPQNTKPRKVKKRILNPSDITKAIQIIELFIDDQGGVNKGCKLVEKKLKHKWQWKYIYLVYAGRVVPGEELIRKLKSLRPPVPPRQRNRKIIEATSKKQLDSWNELSPDELRHALDREVILRRI